MSFIIGLLTGGSSLYIWAAIAIVVLFLLGALVRAWNSPKVAEERAKQTEARTKLREAKLKERTERLRIRREGRKGRGNAAPSASGSTQEVKPRNSRRDRWFRRKNKQQGV